MSYRPHPPAAPLLIGYDPWDAVDAQHLAHWVDQVVEKSLDVEPLFRCRGNRPYDPRVCAKVLVYGYALGIRSSRLLEEMCRDRLSFLFLTRGERPDHVTLCRARTSMDPQLTAIWVGLYALAAKAGIERLGRVTVDSTKIRADVSPESVLTEEEYAAVEAEFERILQEAAATDAREETEGGPARTDMGADLKSEEVRDILRRVRRRMAAAKRADGPARKPSSSRKPSSRRRPPKGGEADTGSWTDAPEQTVGREDCSDPKSAVSEESAVDPKSADAQESATEEPRGRRKLTPKMRKRLAEGLEAIRKARATGRKHLSLTDPDAQMMAGTRQKRVQECHSLEVATDNGLLVAAQSTQVGSDNKRLEAVIEAAALYEPGGVQAVTADSGYYAGDAIGRIEKQGIDTCVPDSNTAGDIRRNRDVGTSLQNSRGTVLLEYDAEADCYWCPQGRTLVPVQERQDRGQWVRVYRAREDCRGCPLAAQCLSQKSATRRTVNRGQYHELLERLRERFTTPEFIERYKHRAHDVETVFGFMMRVLGFTRWQLRGEAGVASESILFGLAYQLRKVHANLRCAA